MDVTLYPLNIHTIAYAGRTFTLIQDTYLPAGTKQRGIKFFYKLKADGYNEIVTYGTAYGYGQVAVAHCCNYIGIKCTVFISKEVPRTKMTQYAIELGANIIEVDVEEGSHITTGILARHAREYAATKENIKLMDMGLYDEDFIAALADNIAKVSVNLNPKRIWVAGGSGTLARALALAFPAAKINVVQVGRKLFDDILENVNHKIYVCNDPFRRKADVLPPYTALEHYDAKVWSFACKYGEDGDLIWNVK